MASSSSSRKRKYDVFVSYRGDDVRSNILSHARRRLNNENIVHFKDNKMERGEEIWPSLKDAIESSTIVLVIFSKGYASSSWCLKELRHILERKEKHGLKVFPIFFHVDPSHVRNPTTGVFADDFAKHKGKYDTLVVEEWISAMSKIGHFSGFHLGKGSEVDLLDKVIEVILQNLEPLPSVQANKLVGIGSHVRKFVSMMSDTQCFLGITGMGGIGKTTIARVVFDLFRKNFEGAIFLSVADVLGRSDERCIDLARTFLSGLMEKEVIITSPFVRHSPHARWLLNKKLLVVLDDVKLEQFQNLVGEFCSIGENGKYQNVFGSGTKIIATSRNKQQLRQMCSNDKSIYEVQGLEYGDALQLFCRHAFGQDYPKEEFNLLLEPFLSYAEGNPLALKVLGSLLLRKTKEEWESLLKILDKNQDQDIYEKLKISYDSLNENLKTIFLYIACYFHFAWGTTIEMLDSCGWEATYGMGVLEERCLLERNGYLSMHNLLMEMGKQIVKQESKDPGKRSILWESNDICRVFSRNSESESVEGIKLRVSNEKEHIVLNPNDFAKVPYLKFLKFEGNHDCLNAQCPRGLEYLPNELRLLDWPHCPLKCLPAQFQPTHLFELILQWSKLEQLWEGRKDLRSLQTINLCFSKCLTKLPDLSCAPNLRIIDLHGCGNLVEIPSSMKHLHKLWRLDLKNCTNLRSIPSFIWKLKSLKELYLDWCSELENLSESTEFPEPSTSQLDIYGQHYPLKLLSISGCGKIKVLPELSGTSLQNIDTSDCASLETSLFDLKQLFSFQLTSEYPDDYTFNSFNFINCWKLDVRWAEIASLAIKRIQIAIVLRHFKGFFGIYLGYPGCEIPKWIKHQNSGLSITLQIPVNEKLLGFAISVIVPCCKDVIESYISVRFNFKNSSGRSFVWSPYVPISLPHGDPSTKLENTIIFGIPLPADEHRQMIDELGSNGEYYEVTLDISYCMCGIKRLEDIKCGMIPLFFQNANGKKLETSLGKTTEIIIKDNSGNLEVFVDDHKVKDPDPKTLLELYKEVTTNNSVVNHQSILHCIWGNENCKKSDEVETFSWLNEGHFIDFDYSDCDEEWLISDSEDEDKDDQHTQKFEHQTQEISQGMEFGIQPNPSQTFAQQQNGDAQNLGDVEPRIAEEPKTWKLTEINEASQCWTLRLPDGLKVPKISRLVYTNSGSGILALASNTIHLFWKSRRPSRYFSGQAGAMPSLEWEPSEGIWMINEVAGSNPENVVPCFALVEGDSKLLSASGGKISIFNMKTFKKERTLMSSPPATTYLACHPQDSNVIAIGTDDSTILICNTLLDKVISELKGHFKRVTGLAFSHVLNVLVSSGADALLCVWSSDGWEKQKTCFLEVPTTAAESDTHVQFHHDQIHFLVVHETQLAIYETTTLQCVKHWVQCESSALISHATFSCDSQLVYACFLDATVCVFRTANLTICSRINPSAYLPANISDVRPLVVAAHPLERNQFALGLSDGEVYILQPLESVGKWDVPAHSKNEPVSCDLTTAPTGPSSLDQAHTYNFIDFMQVPAAETAYDVETVTILLAAIRLS